ncbi:MAG: hypothetical protein AAGD00_06445 [Planctomycetota bacterium]
MAQASGYERAATWLCACGYDLRGERLEACCAECGEPVRASNPKNRVGSAWQREAGLSAWVRTYVSFVTSPRRTWRLVTLDDRHARASRLLATVHAIAVGVVLASALLVCRSIARGGVAIDVRALGEAMQLFVVGAGCGWLLIVAAAGELVAWSRRLGWMIDERAAWAIASHASVGWLVSAFGFAGVIGAIQFGHGALLADPRAMPGALVHGLTWMHLCFAASLMGGLLVTHALTRCGVLTCRWSGEGPQKVRTRDVGVAATTSATA